jgi:flagellar biosynthesis protein FlhG
VLLVDGSQNMGNLHVLFGVNRGVRLEHVLAEAASPQDLLVPVNEHLVLLPADSGAESLHALGQVDSARLHHRISTLYNEFDVVIVDAGPGVESVVRVSTMGATRLIMVTVPEPAALTDAYATMKIVLAQVRDLPIDVLVNRQLSRAIAARFHIRHESPQALVIRNGEVRWHGSHYQVTALNVKQALAAAAGETSG